MTSNRMDFMDNLKLFIILLMLVFHTAMSYMEFAPSWWYVDNTDHSIGFTVFVVWADVFIMPVMFFISGYFGIKSLSRHDGKSFWKSKFIRIILPWAFGAIFIAPLITYLMFASRNVALPFEQYYTTMFWGDAYQQAHYWYLGGLTALYLLLFIATKIRPSLMTQNPSPLIPSRLYLAIIILLVSAASGWLLCNIPDGTWIHPLYILVLQPTRLPMYLAVFFLGVYAWKNHWFEKDGYMPEQVSMVILFGVMSLIYIITVLFPQVLQTGLDPWQSVFVGALIKTCFCFSALFGLLGFFGTSLNFTGKKLFSLSEVSYPIYYVHQIFTMNLVWLLKPLELNLYIKYILACIGAIFLSWAVSRLLLVHTPFFRIGRKKVS